MQKTNQKLLKYFLICIAVLFSTCIKFSIADENVFKVAVVVPLSGALAEYGTAIRDGFELAKLENPKDYSKINFIYEDSSYDGKTAVNTLLKLKSDKSIDLYYLWGVSPTEAMLPIAHNDKLAVIAETTIKEATIGKELVVRAARTGERIADSLAAEIKSRNIKSVSLVVSQIPFYIDIIKHLKLNLERKGIIINSSEEVLPSEIDFKNYLLKQKKYKEEAIGAFLLPNQFITFYKQMDQLKMNNQTFNSDILDSNTIIKDCPDTIENAFFTQVGVISEFREKYRNTYKNDIHVGSAAQAYDVAQLVRDLFGNLEVQLSSNEIIDKISKVTYRKGATGDFTFTESVENGKELRMPVSIKIVRNKKIEVITENTGF